ncbi:hypothetical protein ACN9M0_36715 [Streptomyces sp. R-07]|uniref:hypothetical protein n=1 Tax=unclassified Streptomyces TaxID=2593676 RepID=UPI0034466786
MRSGLLGAEPAALRAGTLPDPVLVQRLGPREQLQAAIERLTPQLPPLYDGVPGERAGMVDAALTALLPRQAAG